MEGKINAEWDHLRKVVVHWPGIEMFFGLLNPSASLYERAFNQTAALQEHDNLATALHDEFKVDVLGLRERITYYAERNRKAKELLVETALSHIEFVGSPNAISAAKKQLRDNIDTYDTDYFLNIILLMPRMLLRKGKGVQAVHINITERDPLTNLYFMRDQQAVTDKGIFLSRMSKPQRRHEPAYTKLLWSMMKLPIAHETKDPGTFEGGDFIPMGKFALVGQGDRTNKDGVNQMLKHGLSFKEVGVVHQPNHPLIPSNEPDPMIDMHLDTYFNVAGDDTVIGSEALFKRAKVDVYFKDGKIYRKSKENTNLFDYMKNKGFNMINLSTLEQMSYSSNFLCIKNHTILAVQSSVIIGKVLKNLELKANADRKRYGALFAQAKKDYERFSRTGKVFPHRSELRDNGIDYYAVDLKNITGGYGGAHCMTAAISRE